MFGSLRWRIAVPFLLLILASVIVSGLLARSSGNLAVIIALSATGAGLLALLLAMLVARSIIRPAKKVAEAARHVASGELDRDLAFSTGDELEELYRACNDMLKSLRQRLVKISEDKNTLDVVLASMADGVIMTDAENRIVLANPAAERLFHFRHHEAIGRSFIQVIRDHEIDNLLKSCIKSAEEKNILMDSQAAGRHLNIIVIPLQNAKRGGVLAMFQDFTELRNLQTMRRELVGNVSHELRTPLTSIKAIVETLEDGAIDDKGTAKDFLARVHDEVDRMTQMVSELTELSRIETGSAELRLKEVALSSLIEEVVARFGPQAERQGITLEVEPAAGRLSVQADRDRIQQVLGNLIQNAIKFTLPGGKVRVSAVPDEKSVTVHVADTGIGISPDDLPHVFERFYKADRARSAGGTGLGLAIAKHIVQAHGGTIWAQSKEGKGSTFSFSIPIKPDAKRIRPEI